MARSRTPQRTYRVHLEAEQLQLALDGRWGRWGRHIRVRRVQAVECRWVREAGIYRSARHWGCGLLRLLGAHLLAQGPTAPGALKAPNDRVLALLRIVATTCAAALADQALLGAAGVSALGNRQGPGSVGGAAARPNAPAWLTERMITERSRDHRFAASASEPSPAALITSHRGTIQQAETRHSARRLIRASSARGATHLHRHPAGTMLRQSLRYCLPASIAAAAALTGAVAYSSSANGQPWVSPELWAPSMPELWAPSMPELWAPSMPPLAPGPP